MVVVPRAPAALGRAVHAVLLERTVTIARAFAGERVRVAAPGVPLSEGLSGPVVAVATDVPRLAAVHFAIAALDLEAGADASFGPTHDGRFYMAALRLPREDLLELDGGEASRSGGFAAALATAQAADLEVGMLRMERRLAGLDDARALLADPLLPAEVRAALEGS